LQPWSVSPGQHVYRAHRPAIVCHDAHPLKFPPSPVSEYRVQSPLEGLKTGRERKRAGLPSSFFRPALALSHTLPAKLWFSCNVTNYRLIHCEQQKRGQMRILVNFTEAQMPLRVLGCNRQE